MTTARTHLCDEVNFNNGCFHLSDKDITRSVAGDKFRRIIKVFFFNAESDELTEKPTMKHGEFFKSKLLLRDVVFSSKIFSSNSVW